MICYCTNIWNHHQGNVCRELANILGDQFKMLLFQPLDCDWSKERIAMGWNLIPPDVDWIIGPPKSLDDDSIRHHISHLIEFSDALVTMPQSPYLDGDAVLRRIKAGRITFMVGERIFKRPHTFNTYLNPRNWLYWFEFWRIHSRPNVHYLTMNHWCADDLRFLHSCKGRIWRWGYLINVSEKCSIKSVNRKVKIGWCGRMLKCKQVDYILRAYANMSAEARSHSEVALVGNGEEEDNLKMLAKSLGIDEEVSFESFMPQNEALRFLEDLDIFVFPSNRIEGWGATLLEAMDKGCAVIANEACGATLEVVNNGVNGYSFGDGDIDLLSKQMERLVVNDVMRKDFGYEAWKTIQDWSPQIGARRLSTIIASQLGNKEPPINVGLCAQIG